MIYSLTYTHGSEKTDQLVSMLRLIHPEISAKRFMQCSSYLGMHYVFYIMIILNGIVLTKLKCGARYTETLEYNTRGNRAQGRAKNGDRHYRVLSAMLVANTSDISDTHFWQIPGHSSRYF